VEHFRRRNQPSFFFQRDRLKDILREAPDKHRVQCVERGDAFSSLTFAFRSRPPVSFSGGMDWSRGEEEDPDWNADLHRLDWMVTLVLGAHISGRLELIHAVAECLRDWERSNQPGSGPWTDPFETAQRSNTLCWLLFTGLAHPRFPDEAAETVLRALLLSGFWIEGTLEYKTPNNHLLIQALRLAQLGLLFPEFPHAENWRRKGMRLLEREVPRQVSTDGVHLEQSSFYQRMTAEALLELLLLCRLNGVDLAESIEHRIQAMFRFLEGILRPDGEFPLIGDGFRSDVLLRYDLLTAWKKTLGHSLHGSNSPNLYTRLLIDGPLEDGAVEAATRSPLEVWEAGGYAVFRSGDPRGENTLLYNFGRFGLAAAPGHGHADCLSLELSVRGRPILVDPGAYSWRKAPEWRHAFRGTLAHNTLVIDGADQTPLHGFFGAGPFAHPSLRRFRMGEHLKWVDASHGGYLRLPFPMVHRRIVVETGPDGWLVIDLAEGVGAHRLEVAWHFDPRLSVGFDANHATLHGKAHPELFMLWSGNVPSVAEVHRGSQAPLLGWVSWESGSVEAASALVLKGHSTSPFWMATAFLHWKPDLELSFLQTTSDQSGVTTFLKTGTSLTTVFVAWKGRKGGRFGKWRTDGALAAVREGADPDMLPCDGACVRRLD
jgi:hypothetical protein